MDSERKMNNISKSEEDKETKNMKIGFIGLGNMASAIINGAAAAGYDKRSFAGTDISHEKADALGIKKYDDATSLIGGCDIIFIAVKPDNLDELLEEISEKAKGKAFVSIVAGKQTTQIQSMLKGARVLRVMPNTPLMVREGAIVLSAQNNLTSEEFAYIQAFLGSVGCVCILDEKHMDAATGLMGSGPAYAFVFIEALADAGVKEGIDRKTAYKLAAQTILGAGKMVLETGQAPAVLKDAVTSPSGTTAAGLYALEKAGFRAAVMNAVEAATKRSRELSGS
ncbi:MAG: pyrroline-5-carboxylate reductase [Christensenellales bacterium]